MFTWICPQCGREVPPAYTECPDCAAKAAQGGQNQPAAAQAEPVPPPPAYQAPPPTAPSPLAYQAPPVPPPPYQAPPQYQAPLQSYQPPYSAALAPRAGLPTWALTVLFALAFLGLGAGVYWTVGYFKNRPPSKPTTAVESPAAKPGTPVNPVQRYIEIAGVRFLEDAKKKDRTLVKFLIVNHSDADFAGLAGNVTLWGSTKHSEEDDEGTFSFRTDLKPNESKELTEPLTTKKKIYELPDWQNAMPDVQITEPRVSAGSPGQ